MSSSIRLGRIFGIEVGFSWSLVLLVAYIAWTLESQLPSNAPHHSLVAYWITAIAAAVLFYACLLVHELSHALVARGRGVKVQGITLWLFGGVARLEGEPVSARDESIIAGVGPLTSIVIAAFFFGLANLPTSDLVDIVFSYLFIANLALAVFNLVPAFPLDGGRLLSAALWWRSGTRQQGVHNAVRIGRIFAYLMIASGVPLVLLGQGLQGVWLAFIGWFLLSAGTQEEAGSTVRTLLRSIPVSAAMTSPVVILPDWVTVEQFLESVAPNHNFSTYPIHEPSGKLTGVVRLRDLVRVPSQDRGRKHLIDVALPISAVPTSTPREELLPLMERLGRGLDQRVLVFEGGQLVGILSPTDVARVVSARQATTGIRPA
jgi:Zn-dependent protease/predicted transcriptional regulator